MAPYQAFRDSDGRYFVMASANDKLWKSTCEALGEKALESDPSFATNPDRIKNRSRLVEILQEKFSTRPRDYWIDLLEGAGVPAGPVNELDEVFQDPWIRDSGLVTKMVHKTLGEIPFLQPPVWVNGERLGAETPPPVLGENTTSVLQELGYSKDAIRSLYDAGVVR
jgi:formyl-CoA transferase